MADTVAPVRANPLQATRAIEGDGIRIAYAGPRQLTQIRARPEGVNGHLPTTPLTTMATGHGHILWLGPDEWLITGDPATTLDALGDRLGASVDVSHRTLAITIEGAHAADLLNAACPLDLHESVMPAGHTARSHFGKAAITLHRTANGFDLYVNRSFAEYTWALLTHAAQEFMAG